MDFLDNAELVLGQAKVQGLKESVGHLSGFSRRALHRLGAQTTPYESGLEDEGFVKAQRPPSILPVRLFGRAVDFLEGLAEDEEPF